MTPLHINIMLHHYAIAEPYSTRDYAHANSQVVINYHTELRECGMLEADESSPSNYKVTEKGMFYINYLLSVPVPSIVYQIKMENKDEA